LLSFNEFREWDSMWDRSILKSNARLALSGDKYWTAYAVCVVFALINGFFNIIREFITKDIPAPTDYNLDAWIRYYNELNKSSALSFLNTLVSIFIGLALIVGLSRFFVHNRFGDTNFKTLFSGFSSGYGNTLGTIFVTDLFIVLWSLLLVIPGIVKAFQYCMVPFILSDNPHMPGSRARQISRMMTDGEKGSIFVLFLSFILWFMLAGVVISLVSWVYKPITTLVSILISSFVTVYLKASFAELYIFLRDRAIQSGMVQPAELGLAPQA
jgi:uncharacterized membrane protein